MLNEKFNLLWNDFGRNAERTIRSLAEDSVFTDVTLISEDRRRIKAHKVVLSSCSEFFKDILVETSQDHPLLFLKGTHHSELQAIIQFIYKGATEVAQGDLDKFMKAAADLEIKGLKESKGVVEDNHENIDNIQNLKTNNAYYDLEDENAYYKQETNYRVYDVEVNQDPTHSSVLSELKIGNFERKEDGFYSCDECEYKTNKSNNLKRHKLGKHQGVKFKCDKCSCEFSQQGHLQTHIKSKHV